MKKDVKLYNMMFPIWFFFLWPTFLWFIILPVNFGIDSLMLIIALALIHYEERGEVWKKSIFKIWVIGFISDLIGAGLVFGLMLLLGEVAPNLNTYTFPGTSLLALSGVIVSGFIIYILNRKFSFNKTELNEKQISKVCLFLALFTAPYTMMIPLYG